MIFKYCKAKSTHKEHLNIERECWAEKIEAEKNRKRILKDLADSDEKKMKNIAEAKKGRN